MTSHKKVQKILVTARTGCPVVFRSIEAAAKAIGCCKETVRDRINTGYGYFRNGNIYYFDYALEEPYED